MIRSILRWLTGTVLVVISYWNICSFYRGAADLPPRNAETEVVAQSVRYENIRNVLLEAGYRAGTIGFGYFLTALILPNQFRHRFAWAFAPGIGLGFCSLIFFIFRRPMFTVEFALLMPICVLWFRRQFRRDIAKMFDSSWRPPVFA